jgi:fucose permease
MVFRLVQGSALGLRGSMLSGAAILAAAAFVVPAFPVAARGVSSPEVKGRDLRLILLTGLLLFAYVGVENGVAGWLPSFVQRLHAFPSARSAVLQATFWSALLAGRLLAGLLIRPGLEHSFLSTVILAALAGTAVLLFCHGGVLIFLAVIVSGAAFAPIFPTAIAVLSAELSPASRERLGWMFAAGGLGGAVLPFCIGALSSAFSSLRTGMSLLLLAECGMFVSYWALRRSCSPAAVPDAMRQSVVPGADG